MGLLDLLLPDRCSSCGVEGASLCGDCRCSLVLIQAPLCSRCGNQVSWPVARCRECTGRRLAFDSARAAVAYEGPATRIVGAWKEGGRRGLARLAAELVAECVPPPRAQVVAYVPAAGERALWRGFNPAAALAHELSARWQLPVLDLLVRRHTGRRQRGLPLAERRRNVTGAFRPVRPSPHTVVLVDDVYTSGATVGAAAGALLGAGARKVEVVTFARTLRRHR